MNISDVADLHCDVLKGKIYIRFQRQYHKNNMKYIEIFYGDYMLKLQY